MPRRRQPLSLRSSSLRVLAKLTVDSCKKSDGKQEEEIRQYVQDIPNTFANEYVDLVFQLSSRGTNFFDITSALHSKCTVISKKGVGPYFYWPHQILYGLHVMRDLINIEPGIALSDSCQGEWEEFPFPKMTHLRSIEFSLDADPQLLAPVMENCPQLERIKIDDNSHDDAMQSTLRLLSNCKHLKRICVPSITPKVAIHLLDHLPHLEVLQIGSDCILKVLRLCKGAYKLKDFVDALKVHNAGCLQKVVTHFPYLEQLTLIMDDNVRLNRFSGLANLKNLKLYNGKASNLRFLIDKCKFGLHELHLEEVTGLESLLRQNMSVPYPNLQSLTIENCTGINLAVIREIFPNLKYLKAFNCEYMSHDLPCKMAAAGFEALEHLEIADVPVQHMRHLIPFCGNLKTLKVYIPSDISYLYELISYANLKELRTLYVEDDSMDRRMIPIILDSCGEYLEKVDLYSSEMVFSRNDVRELSSEFQQYDMHVFINNYYFIYRF